MMMTIIQNCAIRVQFFLAYKRTDLLELLVVLCLGRVVHAAGVPLGVPRAPQVHEVRPEEHQLLVISDK